MIILKILQFNKYLSTNFVEIPYYWKMAHFVKYFIISIYFKIHFKLYHIMIYFFNFLQK